MDGKGEVLALTYGPGQVCKDREDELDRILKDYPDVKVTKNEIHMPGYFQDGAQFANAWLASRPAGSGNYAVWGCWDDPALGALSSIKQMGRDDVKVYGENANADAILSIQDGWYSATSWQDSYAEGKKVVETFKEIGEAGGEWTPVAAEIPPVLITADTVEGFIAEHPESIENQAAGGK
jgi:ribose transport system substrate-binding protein